ncbi:MAG: hypothetical protein RLZZ350_2338 [Verrucomicrobiota bacterium]|jgi:hypothetical protein
MKTISMRSAEYGVRSKKLPCRIAVGFIIHHSSFIISPE